MADRLFAILSLAIPTLAGLMFMAAFGAPQNYLLINTAALALGSVSIWFGRSVPALIKPQTWILLAALLVIMALPLVTGPELNGVSRWLPLGPFQLHAGMLILPTLVALAAADRDNSPIMLIIAVFIATLQPDAAACFAIMGAAVGLYFAWYDWKPGVIALTAFLAGIYAAIRGELPPQQFVERVLVFAAEQNPFIALALLAALLISFFLLLFSINRPPAIRYALAGSMAGFSIAAVLNNYPSILIGYGAAPILGYALALSPYIREKDVAPARS